MTEPSIVEDQRQHITQLNESVEALTRALTIALAHPTISSDTVTLRNPVEDEAVKKLKVLLKECRGLLEDIDRNTAVALPNHLRFDLRSMIERLKS